MKKPLAFLSAYFYPQRVFALSIARDMKTKTVLNKTDRILIDAPCGFGETASLMADKLKCRVIGYDISENAIKTAQERYASGNARFYCSDIIQAIKGDEKMDVMCIINSLFLITEYDKLLKEIYQRLNDDGIMYVIVPNVHSPNYLFYKKNNPSVNILEFTREQINDFFKGYGFKAGSVEGIVFTSFYNKPLLRKLSVFSHFILLALNFVQTQLKMGEPSYFLIKAAKERRLGE